MLKSNITNKQTIAEYLEIVFEYNYRYMVKNVLEYNYNYISKNGINYFST